MLSSDYAECVADLAAAAAAPRDREALDYGAVVGPLMDGASCSTSHVFAEAEACRILKAKKVGLGAEGGLM